MTRPGINHDYENNNFFPILGQHFADCALAQALNKLSLPECIAGVFLVYTYMYGNEICLIDDVRFLFINAIRHIHRRPSSSVYMTPCPTKLHAHDTQRLAS